MIMAGDNCFGAKSAPPLIQINPYVTITDRSEHPGFANLLHGVLGTFRNPPTHTPRAAADWTITEADALDLFSFSHSLTRDWTKLS
jgi:uncharacterized protein (TIGR02391 family)